MELARLIEMLAWPAAGLIGLILLIALLRHRISYFRVSGYGLEVRMERTVRNAEKVIGHKIVANAQPLTEDGLQALAYTLRDRWRDLESLIARGLHLHDSLLRIKRRVKQTTAGQPERQSNNKPPSNGYALLLKAKKSRVMPPFVIAASEDLFSIVAILDREGHQVLRSFDPGQLFRYLDSTDVVLDALENWLKRMGQDLDRVRTTIEELKLKK